MPFSTSNAVVAVLVGYCLVALPAAVAQSPWESTAPLVPLGQLSDADAAKIDNQKSRCRRQNNNFCRIWVCVQNANRLARIWTAFGGSTATFDGQSPKNICNGQQNVGRSPEGWPIWNPNLNQDCTIGGTTVQIGAYASEASCDPDIRPQQQAQLEAIAGQPVPVPSAQIQPPGLAIPATVARGQVDVIQNEAIAQETPLIFAQDPNFCVIDGVNYPVTSFNCQQKLRSTILAPDYVPLTPGLQIPSFVDALANQYVIQGVYNSIEWATKAAQQVEAGPAQTGKRTVTQGDPHMRGFSGDSFNFDGRDGGIYALFSEANHHVNAMFRTFSHIASDTSNTSTWMEAISFRYMGSITVEAFIEVDNMTALPTTQGYDGTWRVEAPKDKQYLRLIVNGQDWSDKIRTDAAETVDVSEEMDVKFYLPSAAKDDESGDGTIVMITTSTFEVAINLESEGVLHLDAAIRLLNPSTARSPGGILGETLMWDVPQAVPALIGEEVDYEVPNLLSTDCVMCTFTGAEVPAEAKAVTA